MTTFYNSEFEAGRMVVTVNRMLMRSCVATVPAYGFNSRSAQTAGYSSTAGIDARQYDTEDAQRIQLREEELRSK